MVPAIFLKFVINIFFMVKFLQCKMSEDLGYTRAIWKRKNEDGVLLEEEGVVPLCWLEGKDIVKYPPKAKKVRALRKKQYPQQDWMYGKIVHKKVTGTLIYIFLKP